MALIVMLANRKDVMGRVVNSRSSSVPGWTIVAVMALAGAALLVNLAAGA